MASETVQLEWKPEQELHPAAAAPGRTNRLLSALEDMYGSCGLPNLQPVDLPLGRVLYESGQPLSHAYFPTTAIVSLSYVLENGGSAGIAVVGNEGVVGIASFMGGETAPWRAVVQSAGLGFRMPSVAIKQAFEQSATSTHVLLRYTQALIAQTAQTAACNRHHSLSQQLSRFLLTIDDRRQGSTLRVTQEQIAQMLGVRREGVTEAAHKLKLAGLISYSRGHLTVIDRGALLRRSCECYLTVKKEYDRLLP